MSQSHVQDTFRGPASLGLGWRVFQIAGLLTAISWIVSYAVFLDGYTAMAVVFGTTNPLWIVGGIGYFLSPLLSIVLIAIAVWPRALALLNRGDATALAARAGLFLIPFLWLGSVFVGDTAMVDRMLTAPLGHSVALPVVGGAFFHTVFQHWFQGFAAMLLALVPSRFSTLTDSDRPAGTGAVIKDVTAQMELEHRLEALHEASRAMMNADSPNEVASIASEATEDVLGIPYSRVHLQDDDTDELVPTAWTPETERVLAGDPPTVDPDSGLVWETFRTGEAKHYHQYDGLDGADAEETPLESSLLLPLGDQGILVIQSTEPTAFSDAKIELAHILSANTQAALARTERDRELALVRALLDQSSDGVFVLDPETGQFLDVNEPACTQLDYTRADLLSMTIHDVVDTIETYDDVDAGVQAAREQGMVTLEGRHRRRDGTKFPVQLTLNHIELGEDYVLGIARDITEREQHHEEVAMQQAELELLGFIQTLIDDTVHQVLGSASRGDVERQVCSAVTDVPYYRAAWLVDPSQGTELFGALEQTADGGLLRSVDDMPPDAPGTDAVEHTIETNATHVLDDVPRGPATADSEATPTGSQRPAADASAPGEASAGVQAGAATAISLPLTYGDTNYGAFVAVSDRPDAFGAREQAALETLTVALAFAIHARMEEQASREEAIELEVHAAGAIDATGVSGLTGSTALITRLAATLECPVRLEGLVPGADDSVVHYYVADTDRSADELHAQIDATTGIEGCRILDQAEECVIAVRSAVPDVLEGLVDAGAVVRTATADRDDVRLVIDVLPDEDPANIRALVETADEDWSVTATRRVDRPMQRVREACDTLEDSLTAKQREALLTAYFAGYYEYPRSSTAQDVANTLAITDSTLFQHLQAAQRKLIEAWLQQTENRP